MLRNAGAGEGEEFPTTTALFSKVREDDEDEDQDDLEEGFMQEGEDQAEARPLETSSLSKQGQEKEGTSNEKGKEVVGDGKGSTVVFQHGGGNEGDQRSTAAVAKTASRIALYMMREEMKDTPVESPVQHSHDFFVISSCGVAAKILRKDEQEEDGEEEEVINFHGLNVDKRLLPGDYDANSAVMARYALDPQGKSTRGTQLVQWRSSMVPLTLPSWEVVAEACLEEGWGETDIAYLKDLVAFVNTFKVLGASKSDVRDWRPEQARGKRLGVSELLSMAIRHFLLIQVGVVEQMYVGHAHSRPWLLHSFKVVRANEELGSLKEAGKLYQGHGPLPAQDEQEEGEGQDDVTKLGSKTTEKEDAMTGKGDHSKAGEEELGRGKRVIKSRRRSDDGESTGGQGENRLPKSRRGSLEDNRGGEDILINPRRKNPQVAAKMSREVAEACEKINWAGVEEVIVAVRPWIRVDGTLNRRVLDRLLGAALGIVMQAPGQTISSVAARLCPALQPAHSRELISILSELGCVELLRLASPPPPTLFSPPPPVVLQKASDLDDDKEVVVEATVSAVTRLGMFIGEKVYQTDFASHCPCHPDRRM